MLAAHGHAMTVITNDDTIATPLQINFENANNKIRIVRFKPDQKHYQFLGHSSALSLDFADIVDYLLKEEGKPDVIECQDFLGIGYFLIQRKKLLWPRLEDIPILTTMHTPGFICDFYNRAPLYRFPNYWIGEMERFVLQGADAIVSPSQFLLNALAQHQVDLSKKFHKVIHNPYELSPAINQKNNQEPNQEFLFIGRLQQIKGVLHLLRYFRELWQEGLRVPLRLIGADTYFHPRGKFMSDVLKSEFAPYFESGLVTHEDKLAPEKLQQRLQSARAVVVPSLFETFPYVVTESMSSGKIVLASSSGGQAEIIQNEENGFLISHESPESFKVQIQKIMDLPPSDIQIIGMRAKESVQQKCSYATICEQKMDFIEKIKHFPADTHRFTFIREITNAANPEPNQEKPTKIKNSLSVVIPYYNMGEYIRETLDCLTKSTQRISQIIIVDDQSRDVHSIRLLAKLKQIYPVEIIHQERNLGVAEARNRGARHATGEFLAFLDADDLIYPDYYEWAVRLLQQYENISFVGCWVEYFGKLQGVWAGWNPEFPLLLLSNSVNSSGLVLRRSAFLQAGLNDSKLEYGLEDYDMTINLVKHGYRGVVIPKTLFKYRVRPDSMARQFNRDNQVYLYRILTEKHRNLYSQYASDVFNLLYENGPTYLYNNPTFSYPPIGFLRELESHFHVNTANTNEIPAEVREKLTRLWKKPLFRKAIQLLLRTKLDKLLR